LIIIKSENGNVFGGYTEQSWSGCGLHSNLGTSFVDPDYVNCSNEAESFLADSYKFKVSEIEVIIFTKS
jgi:hypothetical protein